MTTNNTYGILKSVLTGTTLNTSSVNNTYEAFKAVYDSSNDAIRVNIINAVATGTTYVYTKVETDAAIAAADASHLHSTISNQVVFNNTTLSGNTGFLFNPTTKSFTVGSNMIAGNVSGATGLYSTLVGGQNNSATGEGSSVIGGYINVASGKYSHISSSANNEARGKYSTIIASENCTATGSGTTIIGCNSVIGSANNTVYVTNLEVKGGTVNSFIMTDVATSARYKCYISGGTFTTLAV